MEIRLGPTFDIRAPGPSVGAISIIQFGGGHPNRSIGNQLYMSGRYRRGHTIPRPLAGGRTGRRPLAAGLNVYRLRSFVTPASGTEVSAHSSSRVERRPTTCHAWQKRPMPRLRPRPRTRTFPRPQPAPAAGRMEVARGRCSGGTSFAAGGCGGALAHWATRRAERGTETMRAGVSMACHRGMLQR